MLAEIAWIGQYDSVGQYDEMRTEILSDGDYRNLPRLLDQLFDFGPGVGYSRVRGSAFGGRAGTDRFT